MKKYLLSAVLLGFVAACSDVAVAPAPATLSAPQAEPSRSAQAELIPNSYIVRFRDDDPSPLLHAQEIERTHGAVIKHVYTAAIQGAAFTMSDAAAQSLTSDPSVMSVEQDQTMRLVTTQANPTWGIDRIDQKNLPLSNSYTYGPTGSGVTVYIIDTGILFTHTEYAGRAFLGIDEVTPGGSGVDCNGHGSHVSGTAGGTTYGVAKSVRLVAVRVLDCSGSGFTSGVIAGVDWVTANATRPAAANMSLGGSFSPTLNQAVENSIAAGIVYAIAAGNSTANACLESPSSAPSAIVVAATDITDGFAFFSNFGTCVRIAAPGVNIKSAWIGSNTATNTISGTSMASPHVAGAAALYLQSFPTATAAQVRTALTSNATSGVITGVPAGTPNLLLYTGFLTNPPPVANFTSSCTLLTCSFDGSTSTALPAATYNWTFGDATSGTGVTVSHTYAAGGTYTVTLTVTDANGTSTKTASVTVAGAANQAPVARFTVSCTGLTCSVDGSTSTDDVGVVSYTFDWGDGSPRSPSTVPTATKTYATGGTYTITLQVKDGGGLTNLTTKAVTISVGANQPPVARFTVTCTALTCSLDASTSTDDVGIVVYHWEFGDGSPRLPLTVPTTSKTYAVGGTYTISLQVKDGGGLTNRISKVVTVP